MLRFLQNILTFCETKLVPVSDIAFFGIVEYAQMILQAVLSCLLLDYVTSLTIDNLLLLRDSSDILWSAW